MFDDIENNLESCVDSLHPDYLLGHRCCVADGIVAGA